MEKLKTLVGNNQILQEQGLYTKYKIVQSSVSSGENTIECGFPPKLVKTVYVNGDDITNGQTDFDTTFSTRTYWDGAQMQVTTSSNLTPIGSITRRLYNGFIFTGTGSGTIYFTCFY